MQTFLPYADFALCAAALDYRRLGKQRVEAYQILRTLNNETKGWRNHPAVTMWRGYEIALVRYGLCMCDEFKRRGYTDNLRPKIADYLLIFTSDKIPPWLGNPQLHASHRSNLKRKLPEHYDKFGWAEPPNLPYVWPK